MTRNGGVTVVVRVQSQALERSGGHIGSTSGVSGFPSGFPSGALATNSAALALVLGRLSLRVLGAALIAAGWVARVLADPLQAAGMAAWDAGGSHD
jgi:hypothetical protein